MCVSDTQCDCVTVCRVCDTECDCVTVCRVCDTECDCVSCVSCVDLSSSLSVVRAGVHVQRCVCMQAVLSLCTSVCCVKCARVCVHMPHKFVEVVGEGAGLARSGVWEDV